MPRVEPKRASPPPAGYSGTPLPKKLGIKPNLKLGLAGAPEGFLASLGALPEGVAVRERGKCDLLLWFVRSRAELERKLESMAARIRPGSMWIMWPKLTRPGAPARPAPDDLSEQVVREAGLAIGLVDYKVCAVDATWSALLFTWRKTGR